MNMIDVIRRRMMMGAAGAKDFVLIEATQNAITARILQDSYNAGWIASPDRLMMSEAPNILTIDTSNLAASCYVNTDFSWFQYLENVEIINTYSYGCSSAFVLVPPAAVTTTHILGIRRIKNSKIVLLQRTPCPIFPSNPATPYNHNYLYRNIENTGSIYYVPDDSYEGWLPYIEAAVNCPSWMGNTGITLHRISELSALELSKIKIPY